MGDLLDQQHFLGVMLALDDLPLDRHRGAGGAELRDVDLALDIGESYGKLSWSIRGIYEGYVGWFDLNPATMYETSPSSIYPDLVRLAGGADSVVKLAIERVNAGQAVEALRLTDVVLAGEPGNKPALEARLKALEILVSRCKNTNERGWLMRCWVGSLVDE